MSTVISSGRSSRTPHPRFRGVCVSPIICERATVPGTGYGSLVLGVGLLSLVLGLIVHVGSDECGVLHVAPNRLMIKAGGMVARQMKITA